MRSLEKIRKIILIASLVLVSAGSGYYLGRREVSLSWKNFRPDFIFLNREPRLAKPVDFSLFWDVWERLCRDFIDKTKIDYQKMVWGAISGMVSSLDDPYTIFLPPKENKETKEELKGEFEGIGAQLGVKDKKIVVIAPLPSSPAQKAGILAGDTILKVNDEDTAGWTLPEAVAKIRGPRGTKVSLLVLHEGEQKPVEIKIKRELIKVPSATVEIKDSPCHLAYLKLSRFGDGTSNEWEKAIAQIKNEKLKNKNDFKGVILDLRNNPGGYLQGSVFVLSEFLSSGAVVIQEDGQGRRETFSVNRKGELTEVPLVVLINKGSASAAEIVAGTLKERRRAKILGESSFGKGKVQEAQDLPQGAGLHITTSRWLLPSGASIDGKGVEVDVKIEDNIKTKEDEQLEKAMELICQR